MKRGICSRLRTCSPNSSRRRWPRGSRVCNAKRSRDGPPPIRKLIAWFWWGATIVRQTPANLRKSIDAYTKAIEKDRAYAPAWAGLAMSYFGLCYLGGTPPRQGMEKARESAAEAIRLDPA